MLVEFLYDASFKRLLSAVWCFTVTSCTYCYRKTPYDTQHSVEYGIIKELNNP